MLLVLRCVTCDLPLTYADDYAGKRRLCHDATLREVLSRALSRGVPVKHNLRQHATQPVATAKAEENVGG